MLFTLALPNWRLAVAQQVKRCCSLEPPERDLPIAALQVVELVKLRYNLVNSGCSSPPFEPEDIRYYYCSMHIIAQYR